MTDSTLLVKDLQEKWLKKDDSIGKRLVGKVIQLFQEGNSVVEAILEDDPSLFKSAYNENKETLPLVFWFDVACLCGSEGIVSYLLKECNFDINESNEAIGYALSSGKFNFALELAQLAKEKGKKNPGNIYLYNACDLSALEQIASMFNNE